MRIEVSLAQGEILEFVRELFPLRARLSQGTDRRWLELEPPRVVTLVPAEGLRLSTEGLLCWPIAVFSRPLKLSHVQALLRPQLIETPHGQGLAFQIQLEDFDLRSMPELVDQTILRSVNELLGKVNAKPAWDFSKTLNRRFHVGKRFMNLDAVRLRTASVDLAVTETAIRFGLSLAFGVERRDEAPAPAPSP